MACMGRTKVPSSTNGASRASSSATEVVQHSLLIPAVEEPERRGQRGVDAQLEREELLRVREPRGQGSRLDPTSEKPAL